MNDFKNLTINDINIVQQLPNFRSIRNLANTFKVSPAALSKRLIHIEKCLNRNLITRSTTGIKITDAGLSTAEWANEILIKTNTLPKNEMNTQSKKSITIGSRGFLNSSLIPCFTSAFADNYKLSFIDLSPKDTNQLMQNQQIDISITLDQNNLGESWNSIYIGDLVWELMCNTDNPVASNISLKTLEKYNITHSTFYDGSKVVQGEDFLKVPQNFKNHGHGIQNTASAIAIALSTDQLVFIPKIAAINELKQNKLKIVTVNHVEKTINPIYLNINIDKVSKKSLEKLLNQFDIFLDYITSN
jgi:DNA-binding transcriptional LysR family regulator